MIIATNHYKVQENLEVMDPYEHYNHCVKLRRPLFYLQLHKWIVANTKNDELDKFDKKPNHQYLLEEDWVEYCLNDTIKYFVDEVKDADIQKIEYTERKIKGGESGPYRAPINMFVAAGLMYSIIKCHDNRYETYTVSEIGNDMDILAQKAFMFIMQNRPEQALKLKEIVDREFEKDRKMLYALITHNDSVLEDFSGGNCKDSIDSLKETIDKVDDENVRDRYKYYFDYYLQNYINREEGKDVPQNSMSGQIYNESEVRQPQEKLLNEEEKAKQKYEKAIECIRNACSTIKIGENNQKFGILIKVVIDHKVLEDITSMGLQKDFVTFLINIGVVKEEDKIKIANAISQRLRKWRKYMKLSGDEEPPKYRLWNDTYRDKHECEKLAKMYFEKYFPYPKSQ